ncbi:MAG: MFS transporter [Acidobacteria bacterium]|nr:MFS transporter [Acidobacteriota bacterium]MBI3472706.1 MFS transporter [Candidatus Solibacter usitatus]
MTTLHDSRVRYRVLAFGVCLAAITYLDRVCISVTAKDIMRDLALSRIQMSFVFSAFSLAYAAFEIPTGWWGDRIGTRRVLSRIVAWWSSFTMATAAAFSYPSLLAVRFLFGVGEAGAWPNAARTFSRWFPASERGTAQGIFFIGAHLAGGLTPLLVTAMLRNMHWRQVFLSFGAIGFAWVVAWYRWFRDDPSEHPSVSPAELRKIQQGRRVESAHSLGGGQWKIALRNRNLIALCVMYFTQSYGFYFFITWLPTYLEKERGFTASKLGLLAGLPLLLSVLGDLFGGITTDAVGRRFGLRAGRCAVGAGSFLGAAAVMLAGTAASDPLVAAVLIAFSGLFTAFPLGACWGACIDIGGNHAGVISAAMNTAGQIGGMLSPIIVATVVEKLASWSAPLYLTGALYLVGASCWWFIDPRKPIWKD